MTTTKRHLLFAAVLSAVWLTGCSTPATRIKHNSEAFARLNLDQQALVRAGRVGIGMDMRAVELAVGKPNRITLQTNADGQAQIWHYVDYADYNRGFRHSGPYGGWGRHGHYSSGYWADGYYGFRPARETIRLLIEFKDGAVFSIV